MNNHLEKEKSKLWGFTNKNILYVFFYFFHGCLFPPTCFLSLFLNLWFCVVSCLYIYKCIYILKFFECDSTHLQHKYWRGCQEYSKTLCTTQWALISKDRMRTTKIMGICDDQNHTAVVTYNLLDCEIREGQRDKLCLFVCLIYFLVLGKYITSEYSNSL